MQKQRMRKCLRRDWCVTLVIDFVLGSGALKGRDKEAKYMKYQYIKPIVSWKNHHFSRTFYVPEPSEPAPSRFTLSGKRT